MTAIDSIDPYLGLDGDLVYQLGCVAYYAAIVETCLTELVARMIDPRQLGIGEAAVVGMPAGGLLELGRRLAEFDGRPEDLRRLFVETEIAMSERNVILHGSWSGEWDRSGLVDIQLTRRTKVIRRDRIGQPYFVGVADRLRLLAERISEEAFSRCAYVEGEEEFGVK